MQVKVRKNFMVVYKMIMESQAKEIPIILFLLYVSSTDVHCRSTKCAKIIILKVLFL